MNKTVLTFELVEQLANQQHVESDYVRRFFGTFLRCGINPSYAFKMLEYDAEKNKLSNQTMRAVRAGIRAVL